MHMFAVPSLILRVMVKVCLFIHCDYLCTIIGGGWIKRETAKPVII